MKSYVIGEPSDAELAHYGLTREEYRFAASGQDHRLSPSAREAVRRAREDALRARYGHVPWWVPT
jgi:hypothetical protein